MHGAYRRRTESDSSWQSTKRQEPPFAMTGNANQLGYDILVRLRDIRMQAHAPPSLAWPEWNLEIHDASLPPIRCNLASLFTITHPFRPRQGPLSSTPLDTVSATRLHAIVILLAYRPEKQHEIPKFKSPERVEMSGLVNQSNNRIIWEGEYRADPMDAPDLSSLLALSLTTTYNDVGSTYLNQSSASLVNFQDGVDAEEHIVFEDFIEEEYLDVEPRGLEELNDWAVIESSGPSRMEGEACLVTGSNELLATDGSFYRALDQATKLRSMTSAHRPRQTKLTRRRKKSAQPCSCHICNEKFPRPREMRRHMRKHEKPLRCQRCPASKAEKRDLLRHYRVCHPGYAWNKLGLRPEQFRCPLCLKTFTRKDNLTRHMRTQPSFALFARVPGVGVLGDMWTGFGVFGASAITTRVFPFGPLSAMLGGGDGGESPSFSPAVPPISLQRDDTDDGEHNPEDATHHTACDCARWWPDRDARWRSRGTRATAAAPTVGCPEEETTVNGSEEVVFGISIRSLARNSLTRT
ncbi:hypothetical protein DL764_005374 [Monosporascus ibericus]|uniref:C2H2-type domain-containing protein n=1 Tax=Monosporascus ibericus TaxID=155417 RepID=A0A4Q4TD60_9PEZI|nr:hypothetical protein DL764_005374 [Monosporascus ibericus]